MPITFGDAEGEGAGDGRLVGEAIGAGVGETEGDCARENRSLTSATKQKTTTVIRIALMTGLAILFFMCV